MSPGDVIIVGAILAPLVTVIVVVLNTMHKESLCAGDCNCAICPVRKEKILQGEGN